MKKHEGVRKTSKCKTDPTPPLFSTIVELSPSDNRFLRRMAHSIITTMIMMMTVMMILIMVMIIIIIIKEGITRKY